LSLNGLPKQSIGRAYLLAALYLGCAVFYYLGELVNAAGWDALRWGFLYSIHDFHRLLFLIPIIYAGYIFGMKAVIIIVIVVINTLLPRALFISPYPDPMLRMLLFVVVAIAIGYLAGRVHQEMRRRGRLAAILRSERDQMARVLDTMPDGIIIIGPDGLIRFVNRAMCGRFGEGAGYRCRDYLHQSAALRRLLAGGPSPEAVIIRQPYVAPGGGVYEVTALPFTDYDGAACWLTVFRSLA